MKIWVDADALPGTIKEIVIRAALKRRIQTVFVADKVTRLPESDCLSCVTVESGPDSRWDRCRFCAKRLVASYRSL